MGRTWPSFEYKGEKRMKTHSHSERRNAYGVLSKCGKKVGKQFLPLWTKKKKKKEKKKGQHLLPSQGGHEKRKKKRTAPMFNSTGGKRRKKTFVQ